MLRVGTAQLLVSHLGPELVCGRGRGEHGAPVGVPGLVKQPQLVAEPVQSNIIYISSILYIYLLSIYQVFYLFIYYLSIKYFIYFIYYVCDLLASCCVPSAATAMSYSSLSGSWCRRKRRKLWPSALASTV